MPRSNSLAKAVCIIFSVLTVSILSGCDTISIPTPNEIINKPLGTESVRVGMTKHQVESIWGKPDHIGTVDNKQKWSLPREVWTYTAKYGAIPVDAGYLSKTQKLYFDGPNLTEISD